MTLAFTSTSIRRVEGFCTKVFGLDLTDASRLQRLTDASLGRERLKPSRRWRIAAAQGLFETNGMSSKKPDSACSEAATRARENSLLIAVLSFHTAICLGASIVTFEFILAMLQTMGKR
jgi:hypothetical protein